MRRIIYEIRSEFAHFAGPVAELMFIRRHHLQRLNVSEALSLRPTSTNLGLATRFVLQRSIHVRLIPQLASSGPSRTGRRSLAGSNGLHTKSQYVSGKNKTLPSPATYTTFRAKSTSSNFPTETCFNSHSPDPAELVYMGAADVKEHIARIAQKKDLQLIEAMAEDIVKHYTGQHPSDRGEVVQYIVSLTKDGITFRLATLRNLLADLKLRKILSTTPTDILVSSVNATIAQAGSPRDLTHEISIYSMIYPPLIDALSSFSPTVQRDSALRPSRMQIIWVFFKMISRLIHESRYDTVMPIFDSLVRSGAIPESAMQDVPSTTSFALIVHTILIRCCLNWGWRSRAASLLLRTPEWDQAVSPAFSRVVRQVVDFVLESEEEPGAPNYAAALIIRIVNSPDIYVLSDQAVQQFYALAAKHNLASEAKALYRVTRSPVVIDRRRFPGPQGRSFAWMFNIAIKENILPIARSLILEAIEGHVNVPPLSRAYVVTEAASHGMMSYARTLWERYAEDVFVVGDASVALRTVSLVVSRISAIQHKARRIALEDAEHAAAKKLRTSDAGDTQPEPNSVPPQSDDVTLGTSGAKLDCAVALDSGGATEDEVIAGPFDEQVADYRAFAERVVAAFRRCHEPLDQTPHKILNALARLYIMADNIEEGFNVLKIIRDRGDAPDVRDVNVALSALTSYNPHAGARMLVRMVRMGLQPDTVSFGTVIHQAVLHGDMRLVTSLIARARQVGVTQLDYKTIGTLIRSAVSMPYDEAFPHRSQLENVRDLVDSLLEANYVPSSSMGIDCICAALRADDPVMAWRFWYLLVKDKVDFKDYKQRILRDQIGRNLVRHYRAGVLTKHKAKRMLRDLGALVMLEATEAEDEHPLATVVRAGKSSGQ